MLTNTISNQKLKIIGKKGKKLKKNPIHPGKKSYICEALTPPTIPVAGSKRTLELIKICKKALCGKPEKLSKNRPLDHKISKFSSPWGGASAAPPDPTGRTFGAPNISSLQNSNISNHADPQQKNYVEPCYI